MRRICESVKDLPVMTFGRSAGRRLWNGGLWKYFCLQ